MINLYQNKNYQMKSFAIFLSVLFCNTAIAQQDNENIKKTISLFFDGMKTIDTALIRNSLDSSCFLYSIMQNKNGQAVLEKEAIDDFLQQVISLKGKKLDERLTSFDIKIDAAMAIAWTPYNFYFNDQFSHCGVNVFTLIKRSDVWKIMGITDTRRKLGCN